MTGRSWRIGPRAAALGLCLACLAGAASAQDLVCAPAAEDDATYDGLVLTGPSAYLDAQDVARLSARIAGCPIDRTPPQRAAELVNAAYDAIPAPLAVASVAGIDGRTIRVAVTEVRYGEVAVQGAASTREAYLRARAGARAGAVADVAQLQRRLAALPEIEDIRVDADLEPGAAPGTTDLTLRVSEPAPRAGALQIDNAGDPALGRAQLSFTGTLRSLTGRRDPLSLVLTRAEGQRAGTLSYGLPLGADGMRLTLSHGLSESERIAGDPAARGITSTTRTSAARLTWPLQADEDGVSLLSAGLTEITDESAVAGFSLLDQRVREASVGLTRIVRIPGRAVLTASATIHSGTVRDRLLGSEDGYARLTLDGAATVRLADGWTGFSTLALQVSDGIVPSSQRFAVAGPGAVRGYTPGRGGGDSGVVLRNQIAWTPDTAPDSRARPTVFGLLDLGQSFAEAASGRQGNGWLASLGVGITVPVQIGEPGGASDLVFEATLAQPLRAAAGFQAEDPVLTVELVQRF